MTLDESGKQNEENDEETAEKNSKIEKSNQKESMQWVQNKVEELNKAATKRTFDQISDGQQGIAFESSSKSVSLNETEKNRNNHQDEAIDDLNDIINIIKSDHETNGNDEIEEETEPVKFKVVYAKEIFDITMNLNDTILMLKNHLQKLTSVSSSSQKLCYKGILTDSKTLEQSGIREGVKVMMVGSKTNDILAVSSVTKDTVIKETKEPTLTKEPLCQQKQHRKIIEKGIPEQVMSAWVGEDCPLPFEPLTGMLNKYGNKVRMTFKLEQDELWISTKERTQKIQMTSIKYVISEPIEDYQHYHIMALQIGSTEASRIWFYWVPAQYVRAIKNVILNS